MGCRVCGVSGVRVWRGHVFFFKGLALPWFGSPLADFLQVLAFSGSWFFARRSKERKKETKNKRKI